jgi:hypothetical protein
MSEHNGDEMKVSDSLDNSNSGIPPSSKGHSISILFDIHGKFLDE